MAVSNMLERTVHLDPQPGGILPELHLKKGTKSMRIRLLVRPGTVITEYILKPCVIKATLPDGAELFAASSCLLENRRICARIYEQTVAQMTSTAGKYKCTLTIVNTEDAVNRNNYMNYDILTVLPFTVVIHERARGNEDAHQDI